MKWMRMRAQRRSKESMDMTVSTARRESWWAGVVGAFAMAGLVASLTGSLGCLEKRKPKRRGWHRRQLTPADWAVIKKNLLKAPPAKMTFVDNAKLEDKAVYLGMDVKDPVVVGKPIRLVHYWKCLKPMPDWRLFSHLNSPGPKGRFLNVDHVAVGGRYYVHLWKPGDIIRDEQTVTIPPDWPGKVVEVYVGIWKPGKGRLKVVSGPHDKDNRVLAGKLVIGARPKSSARAAAEPPRTYVVRRVDKPPVIDGKPDDAIWKDVAWTSLFVNSLNGQPLSYPTKVKMVWDDKNLYVLFSCEDPDVWSTIGKHDGSLWTQEVVELMMDPEGDGATYVELQVNPKGASFDAYLPRYRQTQADWESGLKAAVTVQGTLNQRKDKDKGWTVEMAVPLRAAFGKGKPQPVSVGTKWRVNMFRMEVPRGGARVAMAWVAPLKPDFHVLSRFGAIVFGDEKGQTGHAPAGKEPGAGGKVQRPATVPGRPVGRPAAGRTPRAGTPVRPQGRPAARTGKTRPARPAH